MSEQLQSMGIEKEAAKGILNSPACEQAFMWLNKFRNVKGNEKMFP